jgi:NIPSNAP
VLYDLTTITIQPGSTPKALGLLEKTLATQAFKGELLACWFSEIGALNRLMLIRGYDTPEMLEADRRTATLQPNAFGIAELITAASTDTYVLFPFLEPIRPTRKSAFYEVRTYVLKPDGLAPTLEAWRQALPARLQLSPLLAAMHTLNGPLSTFVHVWPYADLVARQQIRARAIETAVWPPPGGPGRLISQQTDIYVPAPFSPL